MIIKIDGTQIKSPHKIKYGKFRLSKSGRIASGKMVMDIIAIKTRIDLTWLAINGDQLKSILDLLNANTFYQLEYPDPDDNTNQSTKTMYVGDIGADMWIPQGKKVYRDITLPFIEQ